MVAAQRGKTWVRRLWDGLRGEIAPAPATYLSPPAGMHTYHLPLDGGQKRIHLRIEPDGSGVLFIDVTDVIHLNTTATTMVKMALDDVPQPRAKALLCQQFARTEHTHITQDLAHMYTMVEQLRTPDGGCPTCALPTILRHAAPFSMPTQAPYKADLALTYGCNNQCSHCYNDAQRKPAPPLRLEEWYQVIDVLVDKGVPHLIFTGGEATLHPHLPDLIQYANQRGALVGLNTNGRRLADTAYGQTLVDAGLNHVQVTIGSHRPEVHNALVNAAAFDQTVQGIRHAVASQLHTITNTTILRPNADHLDELIPFLNGLGIRTFALNSVIAAGGGVANSDALTYAELAPLLVRVREQAADLAMRFLWYTPTAYCHLSPLELDIGMLRCNAGEYTLCVEPDGAVLPCQSYYHSAGNILHDAWETIWDSALFQSFRQRNSNPQAFGLPAECWDCPDLEVCGGGCPLDRHE